MADLQSAFALFGAIHMDRIAHAHEGVQADHSTPGIISAQPGGVASNVARALQHLGHQCTLVGAVGADSDGDSLLQSLRSDGIETAQIVRRPTPTSSYLAIHNPDGSLVAALVDSKTTEAIVPNDLRLLEPSIQMSQTWIIDANLPEALITYIARNTSGRTLVANAVSPAKASRLRSILPAIDLIFANLEEAQVLLGAVFDTAEAAAEALVKAGVDTASVTHGSKTIAAVSSLDRVLLTPLRTQIVDVTGAGDALMAGFLHARAKGLDLQAQAEYGRAAAALTLQQSGAAHKCLSDEALVARLKMVQLDDIG